MADNFDLKEYLKNSKITENQYYKDAEADDAEHIDALEKDMKDDKKSSIKSKIKEMIVAELSNDYDYEEEDIYGDNIDDEANYFAHVSDLEDAPMEDELEEAKKKDKEPVEDIEDIEDVEVTDTEISSEEAPAETGGIENIAADMKGTESDLMDHLMKALSIAKGMQNEKLETQVGNTLKFFVSEYIGGNEQ
jgi:hypothetical protein